MIYYRSLLWQLKIKSRNKDPALANPVLSGFQAPGGRGVGVQGSGLVRAWGLRVLGCFGAKP